VDHICAPGQSTRPAVCIRKLKLGDDDVRFVPMPITAQTNFHIPRRNGKNAGLSGSLIRHIESHLRLYIVDWVVLDDGHAELE
jgi:hypothetical protein